MKINIYNDFTTQPSQHAEVVWTSSNGFCLNAQKEICVVWEEEKGEWNLRKNGMEIDDRKFVSFEELPTYIPWLANSENGRESYEILRKYIQGA